MLSSASLRSRGVWCWLYDRLLLGKLVHTRPIGPSMWHEGRGMRRLLGAGSRVRERILPMTVVFRVIDALTLF
jgi:hypothetical protein